MKDIKEIQVDFMEHAGYKAKIMEAERLVGENTFGLPPGSPISCIPLACLPGAPEEWVREAGSYVVKVNPDKGLWFDWTMNDAYSIGIIPSVKGMNPITGQKIEELNLTQYRDKCTVHKINFSHNNYCEKCGYEWVGQNYVSYPNKLWWDGFRQPDGSVRQFFFTEDEARDIASLVIGKQNTVPAFGFAFYKCKKERIVETGSNNRNNYISNTYDNDFKFDDKPFNMNLNLKLHKFIPDNNDNFFFRDWYNSSNNKSEATLDFLGSDNDVPQMMYTCCVNNINYNEQGASMRDVSVGAGAKISQSLQHDMLPLSEWHPEPQGLIRLYFVFENQLNTIVNNGGIKMLGNKPLGFMNNLPVG